MKKPYWPLCADVFTFWDKVKISKFLFTEKIWTYGEHIRKYESMWEEYVRKNYTLAPKIHAIMVSSGSTANELIALRRKWELEQAGEWPRKNKVIFPVNTWISSVSPWINFGFEPVFVDVSSLNLNTTSIHILEAFKKHEPNTIGTVFYTALLGFFGDLHECKEIAENHGAKFLMDNCEASFSSISSSVIINGNASLTIQKPLIGFTTNSTSLFYSHFTTSGTEGGMIFCLSQEEADWYRMARSHGMTRGMPNKYKNPKVNPDFDFYLMGSNYRSSNLQAYMASLDFERGKNLSDHRQNLLEIFNTSVYKNILHIYNYTKGEPVPLALPIVFANEYLKQKAEKIFKEQGIITRPIIGGCLLYHTAFKKYGNPEDYPIANYAHKCGLYIGLHKNVTGEMVKKIAEQINTL